MKTAVEITFGKCDWRLKTRKKKRKRKRKYDVSEKEKVVGIIIEKNKIK